MLNSIRSAAVSAAVLMGSALVACNGASSSSAAYGSGDPGLAAPNPGGGPIDPFLTNGTAVLHALDAIARHSGKPMRVTSISADSLNGLTVNVQEPDHHANVDEYVIAPDGTLTGPKPVRVMSLNGRPITAESVDARAFDPQTIAFENLTQTARQAIQKSGYSDARVAEWDIEGTARDDRRFIYLESSRARPSAQVDTRLKIVRMSF